MSIQPRTTKEVKIEGVSFVIKEYATALEANAIQQAYYKGVKVGVDMNGTSPSPKITEFDPGVQFEQKKEMVSQMVVSVDGDTNDILNRCLDLPSDIWEELVGVIDEVVAKKKK